MQELAPFLLPGYAGWGVWDVDFIALLGIFAFAREVDKLQDKRSPCYNTAASG